MKQHKGMFLVGRRELVERGRDKSFAISTLFSLAIVAALAILPALFGGGPDTHRLGFVGSESERLLEVLEDAPGLGDARIRSVAYESAQAATDAVDTGELDAAVVDGSRIIVAEELDLELGAALQSTAQRLSAEQILTEAGVTPDQARSVVDPAPLDVEALNPPDPEQDAKSTVAFIGGMLLYGQIFGYGWWVAMGVMEEKTSRVVEIILSKVRAAQLLGGKIIGIGLLGLGQLALMIAAGLVIARFVGVFEFPAGTGTVIAVVGLWFVVGYAFYSCLFAVAGALVSRMDELQNTTTPLTIVLLASVFAGFQVLESPDSLLARIVSFLPPSAPIAMPQRFALGEVGVLEVAAAVAVSVAGTIALVPLAGRLYSGALLQSRGRVKLKDAWRAA